MVSLDHYWKENLKSKQIDFIKLDIEGHEYQVRHNKSETGPPVRMSPPQLRCPVLQI